MRTIDYLAAAFATGAVARPELHEAWIAHSFKLAEIAGTGHIVNAQQNGELDLLIRQIDEEARRPLPGEVDHTLMLRASLSDCWVLRAYEMVRSTDEQLRFKDQTNAKVSTLKRRLGLVRMPVAKAQIQGSKSETGKLVLAHADGTNPKEYINDGRYMAPRGICSETGSSVWLPADAGAQQSSHIRRIDLSNELLSLFD